LLSNSRFSLVFAFACASISRRRVVEVSFQKTSSTLSNRDEFIEFPRKFTQRSRKSSLSIFQRMGIADSENLSSDKI
jgi:hypothetical protein